MKRRLITIFLLIGLAFTNLNAQASSEQIDISEDLGQQFTVRWNNNDSNIVTKSFYIRTVSGFHKISAREEPEIGYAAYFVTGKNQYYAWEWDSKNKINSWVKASTTKDINKVKHFYSLIAEQNTGIETTGENCFLTNAGYNNVQKSGIDSVSGDFGIRSKNKGLESLYIYDKEPGTFIYARFYKDTKSNIDMAEILSFKDKGNIETILADIKKTEPTAGTESYTNYLALSSEEKRKSAQKENYNKISRLLYASIISAKKEGFANLYENTNSFLQAYLKYVGNEQKKNIYFSDEYEEGLYNPEEYTLISKSEGEKIAKTALAYLETSLISDYIKDNSEVKNEPKAENKRFKFLKKKELSTTYKTSTELLNLIKSDTKVPEFKSVPYRKDGFASPFILYYFLYLTESNTDLRKSIGTFTGLDNIGLIYSALYENNIEIFTGNKSIKDFYYGYILELDNIKNKKLKDFSSLENYLKNNSPDLNSINKMSVIIADINDVLPGDFISFKKDSGEKTKYAIITQAGSGSTSIEKLLNTQLVWMDEEEGQAKEDVIRNIVHFKNIEGDFELPQYTEIRRFLVKTSSKTYENNYNWNLLSSDVDLNNASISIEIMREQEQVSPERYKWIPNTGEFLYLEKIKFNLQNSNGIPVGGKDWQVRFSHAEDRNYDASKANQGNIYNNSTCNFELKYGLDNDTSRIYTLNYTLDENNKPKYKTNMDQEFTINDLTSVLQDSNGKVVRIGIRPESAVKARPGDDLLLAFEIKRKSSKDAGTIVEVNPEDYLCVYDKKMLWRANLYLNQKEAILGNLDWNNAHPWNAPPAADATAGTWADNTKGSYFAEWNAKDWGYNEWNRKYNINTADSQQKDLTKLDSGDGTQVVSFAAWTPVRPRTAAGRETNLYTDRVCYDYPYTKDSAGDYINAWDSPFDFNLKMNNQMEAIQGHFSKEVENIKQNFKTEKERTEKLRAPGVFPNGTTALTENKVSVTNLANWSQTTAPNNDWKFYLKKEKSQSETQSYIPGLGLYIHDTKDISYKKYSAGTDCLGFAERAASYKKNIYKWTDLPEGRIEGKDSDSNEREPDPKTTKTHFPQTYLTSMKDNASFLILTKKSIGNAGTSTANAYYVDAVGTKNGPTEEDFKIIKELFQKIIPGDIITYYDPNHIGIVSEVNCNGINRATSIKEIMDNITVVESFYGSTYNYVMVRQSTGGVKRVINKSSYNLGSWFYDWALDDNINLRNFQFERLKFN